MMFGTISNKKRIGFIVVFLTLIALLVWDQSFESEDLGELRVRANFEAGDSVPPKEFTTDACSLFPNKLLGKDIGALCIEHDISYWMGGSVERRLEADLKLRDGGNAVVPFLGDITYWGVRLGGHPLLPFSWRWGYGFPYFEKN